MIYLTKGQKLFENPEMVVCEPTGYYEDSSTVICASALSPEDPVCRFEAKFIAYGSMVYTITDEKLLLEEVMKLDPLSLFSKTAEEKKIDQLVQNIETVEQASMSDLTSAENSITNEDLLSENQNNNTNTENSTTSTSTSPAIESSSNATSSSPTSLNNATSSNATSSNATSSTPSIEATSTSATSSQSVGTATSSDNTSQAATSTSTNTNTSTSTESNSFTFGIENNASNNQNASSTPPDTQI